VADARWPVYDPSQLRVFATIADAARALGVSHDAVSYHLRTKGTRRSPQQNPRRGTRAPQARGRARGTPS